MNIEETKIGIARSLSKDIKELKKKKGLIENLEIKPVTMKEWQELCNTPLRYNDLLLEVAKATFPQGDYFYRRCNSIEFYINDIKISIPTSFSEILDINMSWYRPNASKPELNSIHSNMRKYFELIDSGKYTWYDLAKCRNRHAKSKLELFIWWFTRGKWYKVDRDKWNEQFKKEEQHYKDRLDKYEAKQVCMEKNIKTLKEIIPTLTRFAKVKGYYDHQWFYNEELIKLVEGFNYENRR